MCCAFSFPFSRALGADFRVLTATFRSGVYQSMASFAICDMMMVSFLLLFCLKYYTAEQHKLILAGQAGTLFISQIMLAGKQGDMLDHEMALAGSIGTFFFIVIAILGAL